MKIRVLVKRRLQNLQQISDTGKVAYFRLLYGLLAQMIAQHVFRIGVQHLRGSFQQVLAL